MSPAMLETRGVPMHRTFAPTRGPLAPRAERTPPPPGRAAQDPPACPQEDPSRRRAPRTEPQARDPSSRCPALPRPQPPDSSDAEPALRPTPPPPPSPARARARNAPAQQSPRSRRSPPPIAHWAAHRYRAAGPCLLRHASLARIPEPDPRQISDLLLSDVELASPRVLVNDDL